MIAQDWQAIRAAQVDEALRRPMAEHIVDWATSLQARDVTKKHVRQFVVCVTELCGLGQIVRLSDLSPQRLQTALGLLRQRGLSPASLNRRIVAIRAFCKWALIDNRLPSDPTLSLRMYNTRLDQRHQRRALADAEVGALLRTAFASKRIRYKLSGKQRAMLYQLAVETGLRASELRKLKPRYFSLAGPGPATLTLPAHVTKNRREAQLPIRREFAALLRKWLDKMQPDDILFPVPASVPLGRIMRHDLDDAGIPYRTDKGFADFHSLRHTYCTRLVRAGLPLAVVKQLARHADFRTTLGYTHVNIGDMATAVESLPAFSEPANGDSGPENWSHGESNPDLLNAIQATEISKLPTAVLDAIQAVIVAEQQRRAASGSAV
jgi:site-specific recombinase XerD